MRNKTFLLAAIVALAILPASTSAQGPQYTDAFISSINRTYVTPCGNTGAPTSQIQAALADLTFWGGGTLDLSCYTAPITITSDIFSAVTSSIILTLPEHAVTVAANATIPSNFAICGGPGSSIAAKNTFTLTNNASACLNAGSGIPGSLGNGTTVIDVSRYKTPLNTFDQAYNLAVSACTVITNNACEFDARGISGAQTTQANSTIYLPFGSLTDLGNMTLSLAQGSKIVPLRGSWLHGAGVYSTYIQRSSAAISAGDTTPLIFSIDQVNPQIDNIQFLQTTPSGANNPFTSIAAATSTAYTLTAVTAPDAHGFVTFSSGSFLANAPVAGSSGIIQVAATGYGTSGALSNNGTFMCSTWTTTSVTCYNPTGYAQTGVGAGSITVSTAAYSGTFSGCDSNACVGQDWSFRANNPGNSGFYTVVASTASALTAQNGAASVESLARIPGGYFAVKSGGWAIDGPWNSANFHDIQTYNTALGMRFYTSGCSCYNTIHNAHIYTTYGALFMGTDANENSFTGVDDFRGSDWFGVGATAASGFGVWLENNYNNFFGIIGVENTAYPIMLRTPLGGTSITQMTMGGNPFTLFGIPVLLPTTTNTKIPLGYDVVDLSGGGGPDGYNTYGSNSGSPAQFPNPVFGSLNLTALTTPNTNTLAMTATCVSACTGATYQYGIVAVDGTGYLSSPPTGRTTIYSYPTVQNNATLSSTNYNTFGQPSPVSIGTACFDLLKYTAGAWQALATCLPYSLVTSYADTGQALTTYTVPTRNSTGDFQLTPAGQGVGVKSPDGSHCGRIGLDNTGAVAVTSVTCW